MALPKKNHLETTLVKKSPSYLTESLVGLELTSDLKDSVKDYLQRSREVVYEKMDAGEPAERLVRLQSLMFDQLITALYAQGFEESQSGGVSDVPLALFALGGYGRGELNIFSDIDLLFFYEGKSSKTLEHVTKSMLYPLWDAKVEVGYATRNLQECARVMQEDIRAMSSLLDARFLAGDRNLAADFFQFLEGKITSASDLKKFIRAKVKEAEDRLKRFGGSVYVIEPNLKESEGGLRDYHTLRYFIRVASKTSDMDEWIRRGFITNEEADKIHRAVEFLWDVRNRLHRKVGSLQDQLLFAYQEPIALEMGFETSEGTLGVEKFMQTYYGHASNLHRLRMEITRRLMKPPTSFANRLKNRFRTSLNPYFMVVNKKVTAKNYAKLEKHPVEIMRAFWFAQQKKLLLDEELKSWVSQHLHLIDESYRSDPEVCRMFREMIADVSGIGRTFWEMYDCRFLGVIIPEFGDILFQTQHDVYHVYTVDTHSILAVEELSKLKNGVYDEEFPVFKRALEEIHSTSSLVLSVLFHDIGKGKGGGHSEIGAKLARKIMARMGYPEKDQNRVEFLVLSHLIMPHLSQRRDLEDAALIAQFARTIETRERLNLLFILTWADIRAVGPEVWTPWKGSLLQELYEKTKSVLETGEFNTDRVAVIMEQAKREVLQQAPQGVSKERLQSYLNAMPPRYFLANSIKKIIEHFNLIDSSESKDFLFHQSPNLPGNYNDVLIYTAHTPHLFEQVTGVMAANQINILALEQFLSNRGEVLLQLKVTDRQGRILDEERRFTNLQSDLRQVIQRKIVLADYYASRKASSLLRRRTASPRPPRVEIDNVVSPYYTIIDIYATDRIGLLYDLAKVIRELNLFIEVSKISTKVDQVADVFYVKDIFGHKVTDKKKRETIKEALLQILSKQDEEV
jgi:[protein-PII] uridylyltransferase